MQQRLEEFLSSEGLTKSQFADSINVARAAISHIAAGRNKPSYEFIVNTMNAYPHLNIEWLLNGKGSMYKDGSLPKIQENDLFSFGAPDPEPVSMPEPAAEKTDVQQVSAPAPAEEKTTNASIKRIVVYYSDGTYKDFIPDR